jgi:hypothetical protein
VLLPALPARAGGSVGTSHPACVHAGLNAPSKAQTSSLAARPRVGSGLKIDQGRSLLRAPRRCLRSSCPHRTRVASDAAKRERDLVFEPLQYTEALGLTSSRSSDYSLVKELSRSQTSADDFHRLCRAFPDPIPVRGGGIIASATRLSTGVVRFAHVTFARPPRATPASSESLDFKGVAYATSGRQ